MLLNDEVELLKDIIRETLEAIKDDNNPEDLRDELKTILKEVKEEIDRTLILYE